MGFRFGNFEIDAARQELRRAGEAVHIEPQVFDLLVHLVQNRDRIVSKDELIDTIWRGRAISEAALSSCVSAARRALDDNGNDQALVRTLHKRGFRFVGDVDESSAPAAITAGRSPLMQLALPDAAGAVSTAEPAPLSDRPSIAVLPFENMSCEEDQEYFADGLTEDIITGLSRQPWFSVIARNSSFTYKGQAVDVRDVSAQLGVRYVLEGSVRKAANRVRVTGQLIDAANGNHLWAEKYDRELADIFALQDDITNRVIGSVSPHILVAEAARVERKPPLSIDAWDLVMQSVPHMWRMNTQEHARAQALLRKAIELDGNYAHAHALLGWTYVSMFNLVPAGRSASSPRRRSPPAQGPSRSMTRSPGPTSCSDWATRGGGGPGSLSGISRNRWSSAPASRSAMPGSAMPWHAAGNRKAGCRRWRTRTGSVRAIRFWRSMRPPCGTWPCSHSNGMKRLSRCAARRRLYIRIMPALGG